LTRTIARSWIRRADSSAGRSSSWLNGRLDRKDIVPLTERINGVVEPQGFTEYRAHNLADINVGKSQLNAFSVAEARERLPAVWAP